MTEAEKIIARLEYIHQANQCTTAYIAPTLYGEAAALIRDQAAKIERMSAALRDCPTGCDEYGVYNEWRERHAQALRDAEVEK